MVLPPGVVVEVVVLPGALVETELPDVLPGALVEPEVVLPVEPGPLVCEPLEVVVLDDEPGPPVW